MTTRPLGESWAHLSHVPLRLEPSDRAECINELLAGETVTELELGEGNWVRVRLFDGYEGWLDRRQLNPVSHLWQGKPLRLSAMSSKWDAVAGGWLPAGASVRCHEGVWYLGERIVVPAGDTPEPYEGTMWDWAKSMCGVPYHWGGRSGWGFDCSGLTSIAASLVGLSVPRDASEQWKFGHEVGPGEVCLDDIAFFQNAQGQITHVGICDGDGHVVHASGEVRVDVLNGEQLFRREDNVVSHQLAGFRRWS